MTLTISKATRGLPVPADGEMLLQVTGLGKSFGGQVVLDNLDLELRKGEVVLLRGENGCGKTTLLNILTGNLEPDSGVIRYGAHQPSRDYTFPRRWWQGLNPFDLFRAEFVARRGIGRTWQDIRLFHSLPLRENIAVAAKDQPGENPALALLAPGRTRKAETRLRIAADGLLARVGLAGRESSSADKVSLGQAKRVALLRAVATGAPVLFLDEPLAGLDRQGVSDILALLDSLLLDRNLTLVIVEHVFNQPHLTNIITTDWLLKSGKLERNVVAGLPRSEVQPRIPTMITHPAWLSSIAGPTAVLVDEFLPHGAVLTRVRLPEVFRSDSAPLMEIRNLVVKRGYRTIIGLADSDSTPGFNLVLHAGEILILQAPNGWGKSTLFAALCGLSPIAEGEIIFQGQPIHHLPMWERVRRGLRALPSDQNTFPSLKVREALRLAGTNERTREFGPLADRVCSSLSGGERQRAALASLTSSNLQLLDEPFSNLDQTAAARAMALIRGGLFQSLLIAVPSVTN